MIRSARPEDACSIHRLITKHRAEGHLLPRTLPELTVHADRFVVATLTRRMIACAELAPLSDAVAEVRSLVVSHAHRGQGLGRRIVDELRRRARLQGFDQLCAFAHEPAYFARMGFSIVPHARIPEKIATDCRQCPLLGRCGQYAMIANLEGVADSRSPIVTLRA